MRTTQKQIAERLGVTPQFLSQWKLGQCGISAGTALRWSRILKVDVKRLLTADRKEQRVKILGLEK